MNKTKQQIYERYMQMGLEGLSKIPNELLSILEPSTSQESLKIEENNSYYIKNSDDEATSSLKKISTCTSCDLSKNRKLVLCSTLLKHYKYMAISEFPETIEEHEGSLFSDENSASILIKRLLLKLNIFDDTYLSFALKCVPKLGVPNNGFTTCAGNLKQEIAQVQPTMMFIFGNRVLQILKELSNTKDNRDIVCGSFGVIYLQDKPINVLVLPSARDLRDFPEWRSQVWKVFQEFLKNSIQ